MEWFRQALIEAHKKQRKHLEWILSGLEEEQYSRQVTDEQVLTSIENTVRHIGNAETYWFHKSNHNIGPPIGEIGYNGIIERLAENSKKIAEVLLSCDSKQLQIRTGMNKQTPSVAWALLRTYQHGLYHAGQISKLRRILGAEDLPPHKDELWSNAVDAVIDIITRLLAENVA